MTDWMLLRSIASCLGQTKSQVTSALVRRLSVDRLAPPKASNNSLVVISTCCEPLDTAKQKLNSSRSRQKVKARVQLYVVL